MPFLAGLGAIGAVGAAGGAAGGAISLSSLLSVGSGIIGGIGQIGASMHQKKVAEINAQIARDNAERAIHNSQLQQQEQDEVTAGFLGEQLGAQSASGLSVGSGSARAARATGRRLGRQAAVDIRKRGEFQAHDFLTQAVGFENEAASASAEASGAALQTFFGAGSLLTKARPTRRSTIGSFVS